MQIPIPHCEGLQKRISFSVDFAIINKDDRRLKTLPPYLREVPRRVHEPLEVLVADLVLVHVEAVQAHPPGRALPVLPNLRLIRAHREHPSRNSHHLQRKQSTPNRSPPLKTDKSLTGFTPPPPHLWRCPWLEAVRMKTAQQGTNADTAIPTCSENNTEQNLNWEQKLS